MAQIIVDGVSYEVPENLKLGELGILERYTQGHLAEDGYESMKIAGLIHVAIARTRKDASFDEIQEVVYDIDPEELDGIFQAGQSPPAGRNDEPDEPSSGGSVERSGPGQESGNPNGSGVPGLPTGFTSFHGISTTSPRDS